MERTLNRALKLSLAALAGVSVLLIGNGLNAQQVTGGTSVGAAIATSLGVDNGGASNNFARFNGTFNYANMIAGLSTAAGATGMLFQYRNSGGNPLSAMFIDSTGNVGLGAPTVSGSTLTGAILTVSTTGVTYNVNTPAANTVVCYKTGGVLGWASNTAGVIGTTCN